MTQRQGVPAAAGSRVGAPGGLGNRGLSAQLKILYTKCRIA